MTGVLDYGIGNIGSILNMIKKVGAQGAAVRTAEELSRCDRSNTLQDYAGVQAVQ